ncbi:uncharacterized protein LOC132592788 [Zootoca vivipara]|uniref:uncharacterized protein LOC132592788 n=1 Tax=Zootoca vivipara TaxID=8524 RepID=UPI00293BBC1E|nr:uncharacterized protein LOC132592788 [Zootoca vivipara]
MAKKVEMRQKNRKGNAVKWYREDFFILGPSVFYNDISKVAKAFGEHLTPSQVNEVVLTAIDNLAVEDRAISQAAGVLLSSFLEECGMDMEDLPMVVKEIYNHLLRIPDSRAKEEALMAVVNLATKRLNPVVDSLLDCSMDCDEQAAAIWKALAANAYCRPKLLRPLLQRLQNEDPNAEVTYRRRSTSVMPMVATNVLCWLLSLPEAGAIVEDKFGHLLLALATQLYFLLGASRRSIAGPRLDPLATTVQALQDLIRTGGYAKEYSTLREERCWEMLASPGGFFQGIRLLIRTLFTCSKVHLRTTFKQANDYLHRLDAKERAVGMAFFSELLFHPEIGRLFSLQYIMDTLIEWMVAPSPLMQMGSMRGLGYILEDPLALSRYTKKLPGVLRELRELLRFTKPEIREAAALLTGFNAQYLKPDVVSSKEIDAIYRALLDLQGDLDVAVSTAAVAASEELLRHCGKHDSSKPRVLYPVTYHTRPPHPEASMIVTYSHNS